MPVQIEVEFIASSGSTAKCEEDSRVLTGERLSGRKAAG